MTHDQRPDRTGRGHEPADPIPSQGDELEEDAPEHGEIGEVPHAGREPAGDELDELASGDVRTGGGTGWVGGGEGGAGDDDVGTGMGSGGGGVDVGSGIVSALDIDEEQQRSGRLSLNREYSTGDLQEYGTGGGDVGIGGDVTPHGEQHDAADTAADVERADMRFREREIADEGGYLEHSGFPPEYAQIEEEDEPTYLDENEHTEQLTSHERAEIDEVTDEDDPFIHVEDDDELFGT